MTALIAVKFCLRATRSSSLRNARPVGYIAPAEPSEPSVAKLPPVDHPITGSPSEQFDVAERHPGPAEPVTRLVCGLEPGGHRRGLGTRGFELDEHVAPGPERRAQVGEQSRGRAADADVAVEQESRVSRTGAWQIVED